MEMGAYPQIDLDPAVPPMLNRPRKIPHNMRAAVEDKLRVLEENGIIAAVEQPTEWISNITTVWKPEKKSVCVCLDPRDLNKAIRRNHFHLPTLDDVLTQLKGARVFSLLDAKDGFLQVKLSESSSFLGSRAQVLLAQNAIWNIICSGGISAKTPGGLTRAGRCSCCCR